MKKKINIHELAVKLCEGQVVWFQGHAIRAVKVTDGFDVCFYCDMDSLCTKEKGDLCAECDDYDQKYHILQLVSKK